MPRLMQMPHAEASSNAPQVAGSASSALAVTDAQAVVRTDGTRGIAGTIVNQGSRTYSRIYVEITLYNEADTPIDTVVTRVADLRPGAQRTFEAPITYIGAGSFRVTDVTAQ
jgi:hypothetical protein